MNGVIGNVISGVVQERTTEHELVHHRGQGLVLVQTNEKRVNLASYVSIPSTFTVGFNCFINFIGFFFLRYKKNKSQENEAIANENYK